MKKEDLKTGMFIVTRGGELGLIIRDFLHQDNDKQIHSDIVMFLNGGYTEINDYDENLRLPFNKEFSIENIFIRNINNISPKTWKETHDREILY